MLYVYQSLTLWPTGTERDRDPVHVSGTRERDRLATGKRDGTRVDPAVIPGHSPPRGNPCRPPTTHTGPVRLCWLGC